MNRDYIRRRSQGLTSRSRTIVNRDGIASNWNPIFYVQTENTNYGLSLWTLPNVYPMVYVDIRTTAGHAPSGYPTRVNNATGCAQMCADWVQFYSSGINRDTGRTIDKYALQLTGFGQQANSINAPSLFYNPGDRLANGQPGPWIPTGIKQAAEWTSGFVQLFKAELTSRSLLSPTRLVMDFEESPNYTGILNLLSYPKANTELIDGRNTLSGYWAFNSGKLPNGSGVSELLDGSYDWRYNWWGTNIITLIRDYALYESCYKFFASGFPGIRTCNYDDDCGTLTNPGYQDARFNNCKYFVSGLYATDQNPKNYNRYFLDQNTPGFTEALYGTYDNCISFYNVSNTGTVNAALAEMYVNKCRFQVDSNYNANPNIPVIIWHEHEPTGAITFDSTYISPNGGSYAITSGVLLQQLQQYGLSRVDNIIIFEPNLIQTINDNYYFALTNLNGLHDTSSPQQSSTFPVKRPPIDEEASV